jgi:hypothetical protein
MALMRQAAVFLFVVACSGPLGCGSSTPSPAQRTVVARSEEASPRFCRRTWRGPIQNRPLAARLYVQPAMVAPEAQLTARIENLGKSAIEFGEKPEVDQKTGSGWSSRGFEVNGVAVAFPSVLHALAPRSISSCISVPASSNWTPGLYRLSFEVRPEGAQPDEGGIQFRTYFRVGNG